MYKILALFAVISLASCDDRFIRKEINNNDISVQWFYKSYITSNSPDFVTVSKGNEEREIYRADDVVTGVTVKGNDIIIKLYKPERGIVYTKTAAANIFGYRVVLDSSANRDEYRYIPDGKN